MTSKNIICFIIPIHPPDFKYVNGLIQSKIEYNVACDLYFIMTNDEDKNIFNKMFSKFKNHFRTLNSNYDKKNSKVKNPVVYKKYFGLLSLKNKYDFLCCVDSEIIFIKKIDINKKIAENYNKKTFYASKCDLYTTHTKAPLKYFLEEDVKYLESVTNNFHFWCWFNNIPIYEKNHLNHFFDFLNLNLNNLNNFDFFSNFEQMLYQYFLILKYDFKIVIFDINTTESLLERANRYDKQMILSMDPLWYPNHSYQIDSTFLKESDIFMLFHLDRLR